MESTIDKTRTKKLGILELINNCRIKLSGLYSLINADVLRAKQNVIDMGVTYTQVSELYDNLKGIFIGVTNSKKEDRARNLRASKPVVKKTNTDIDQLTKEFWDLVDQFNAVSNNNYTELRTQYKTDVAKCCKVYKSIGEANEGIDKGYRQQVTLIRRILDKINIIILEYKDEKAKVEELVEKFKTTLNFTSTLSDKILECN